MTKILWYITPVDGRAPWLGEGADRYPAEDALDNIQLLAKSLDRRGFYGTLQGTYTQNAFTTLGWLAPFTERLRFLVPIYPGLTAPRVLAEQAYTFDLYSKGRLLFNLVNGTDQLAAAYGFPIGKKDRYEFSRQYWNLFTAFYSGEHPSYEGTYLSSDSFARAFAAQGVDILEEKAFADLVLPGRDPITPIQHPHVPLWGAGASADGVEFSGEVVDTYLVFLREEKEVATQIADAQAAAARHGRSFDGVGIHGSLTVRESDREALDYFYHQYETAGADAVAGIFDDNIRQFTEGRFDLKTFPFADENSRNAQQKLLSGRLPELADLEISPHLYQGLSAWGQSNYIVGSGETVATKIRELQALREGIDTFIFSGWPLIQESEYVADYLFPYIDDLEV